MPDALFKIFQDLDIQYKNHHHAPIFTVEEGLHLKELIPGIHCRNLFLRDKKGAMILVVAANETPIDLKKLPDLLGCGRLSFGSAERLMTHLGIYPGAVCPFAVINDRGRAVRVVLDAAMMRAAIVNYHPLDNARTVSLSPADLLRFFAHTGHQAEIVDLTPAAP